MPSNGGIELATAADLAVDLGVHKTTIHRIAKEHALGTFIGNQRVFTRQEAASIRKHCHMTPGNPQFSKSRKKK